MKLSTSIKTLRDKKIKDLVAKESDTKAKLLRETEQKMQPLEEVNLWLTRVEAAKTKVEAAITTYEHKGDDNCFVRLRQLFELAESVEEEVSKEVEELLGKQFQDGLVMKQLPAKATLFNSSSLLRIRSTMTEKKVEEIMRLLKDPKVGKIGVYGMGGVGKTTIMKTVNDRVAAYFARIIWVTVTKEKGGIEMLQSMIAEQFGEDFQKNLLCENDKEKRASMLSNELKNEKKLLLILDDLWDEISLDKVGIPDPQRTSSSEGCKIAVTTRSLVVCDSINTQANVQINCLSDEDAWNLFEAIVENDDLLYNQEIEPLARDVVRECGGLPLAIITIAPVMKRMKKAKQWSYNLDKLRKSRAEIEGPDGNVFQLLRFSYDHLKTERIKKCFLYCAFYPEDHQIKTEDLIEYWMVEGFIEEEKNDEFEYNTSSRSDEIGKGLDILKEITDSCMLETIQEKEEEYVKMHDLLRDLAIRIMREDYGFISKAGMQLKQFPDLAWEKVSKISLMDNRITFLPQLNCPNLSTLLLRRNGPILGFFAIPDRMKLPSIKFPESFFSQMLALEVLDLSQSDFIKVLPSSLSELTNLRALYLQFMRQLQEIPSLAKLTKLQVLHLGGTSIKELQGLENLASLKFLNLDDTSELNYIQADDALYKLSLLEELHLWECQFFSDKDSTCIQDLTHLRHLSIVRMSFSSYENYLKAIAHIKWNNLTDFSIKLCVDSEGSVELAHKTKVVSVYGLDIYNQLSSFCIPVNTEALLLSQCDIPILSKIPCINSVKSLKKLYLEFEDSRDCLVMGNEMKPNMLASLEALKLEYFYELKVIWKGVLPSGCLRNLKSIYVDSCHCLKNLFSFKILQQLKNIEVIKVTFNDEIEEISGLADEDDQRDDTLIHEIALPKLRILHLRDLPNLHSISTKAWVCESLKIIAVFGCPGLRKFPFERLSALKSIYGTNEWWEQMEWDDPASMTALQPLFMDCDSTSPDIAELGAF
ncbi:hypothetical protein Scep_028535 [Stephania cephalantha]|uniref:NB-ARC domain-containing protein n=1 Tax=Stephania cephalantha TaxID=152367 RepID=A0AAP0EHG1_9MAGN